MWGSLGRCNVVYQLKSNPGSGVFGWAGGGRGIFFSDPGEQRITNVLPTSEEDVNNSFHILVERNYPTLVFFLWSGGSRIEPLNQCICLGWGFVPKQHQDFGNADLQNGTENQDCLGIFTFLTCDHYLCLYRQETIPASFASWPMVSNGAFRFRRTKIA